MHNIWAYVQYIRNNRMILTSPVTFSSDFYNRQNIILSHFMGN